MLKLRNLALLMAAGIVFSAQAMEQRSVTKETLLSLVPQLESHQQEIVTEWKQEHAGLLAGLNALTSFNDWRMIRDANNATLKEQGLENKSKTGNYTVIVPKAELLAKIAGPANKRQSIIQAQGAMDESNRRISCICSLNPQNPQYAQEMLELRKFHDEQFEQYLSNRIPTYQDISWAANGKMLADEIERLQLNAIKTPKVYLEPFKGQKNATVPTDETHFALEELIPDYKEMNSAELRELAPKIFVQIIKVVQAGHLWNNKYATREDGTIIVHCEQPNCVSPHSFLEPDTTQYYESITCDTIANLLRGATPEQKDAAKSYILSNAELQKFFQYDNKVAPLLK